MARVAHFLVFLVSFVDQCFMVSVVQFSKMYEKNEKNSITLFNLQENFEDT
jgi:hypothetical protein